MIKAQSISFEYPGVLALDAVSLSAEKGSVIALVGPNGAGKSTLLRCLAALERPAKGRITIDGIDAEAEPRQCHARIGYLRDLFGLYDNLTTEQCLTYAAEAHGIAPGAVLFAVRKSAEALQITNFMDKKAGALSRGLRQRLAIAQTIVHEPKVLLLDEPASGLDPEARHSLSALFKCLAAGGMTLVVSSHILTELEEYSTSMVIINKGKVVSSGAGVSAPAKKPDAMLRISLVKPFDGMAAALGAIAGVSNVNVQGPVVYVNCAPGDEIRHTILKRLMEAGAPVCGIVEVKESMQSAYLKSLGEARGGGHEQ